MKSIIPTTFHQVDLAVVTVLWQSQRTPHAHSPLVWNAPREKPLSLPPGFEQGEAIARHPLPRHRVLAPPALGRDALGSFLDVSLAFSPQEIVVAFEEVVHIGPGREGCIGGVCVGVSVGAVVTGIIGRFCRGSRGALRQRGDENQEGSTQISERELWATCGCRRCVSGLLRFGSG